MKLQAAAERILRQSSQMYRHQAAGSHNAGAAEVTDGDDDEMIDQLDDDERRNSDNMEVDTGI